MAAKIFDEDTEQIEPNHIDDSIFLPPDLYDFAFAPPGNFDMLAGKARREEWRFKAPERRTKNMQTPILEYYLRNIYALQARQYNARIVDDPEAAATFFDVKPGQYACFNTGLYTDVDKQLYAYFGVNSHEPQGGYQQQDWFLVGFADEASNWLKGSAFLPQRPDFYEGKDAPSFRPGWKIRTNTAHILDGMSENLARLPDAIRNGRNLPRLIEVAVEMARRKVEANPRLVARQAFRGKVQLLLPIYLTDLLQEMEKPDLVMPLTAMDGYYVGNTALTLQMAYLNARLLERPTAPWLLDLLDPNSLTQEIPLTIGELAEQHHLADGEDSENEDAKTMRNNPLRREMSDSEYKELKNEAASDYY